MALASCSLIGEIPRDCRDSNGGIIEIKVKVLPSLATLANDYSVSSGTVSILTASRSGWYTFYIEKQTASFDEDGAGNAQTGTNAFNQTGKIIFNKKSVTLRNDLQALMKNACQIAVRDRNDAYELYGYEFGMDLNYKATTGTAISDRNGYELTFTGNERIPVVSMSAATYNSLEVS